MLISSCNGVVSTIGERLNFDYQAFSPLKGLFKNHRFFLNRVKWILSST